MEEKRAHKIYDDVRKVIEKVLGNKTTFGDDLDRIGSRLFSSDWHGVWASDQVPSLSDGQLAILNLDKSHEPGSHWIAVARDGDDMVVYDSFGRKSRKIIRSLFGKGLDIIDSDYDSEQRIVETNCGARSMAWLVVYKLWGREMALLI